MTRPEGAPDIESLDDLLTTEEVRSFFAVAANTVMHWRYGYRGPTSRDWPELPYIRIGRRTYFSKKQITWWLNEMQKTEDPFHLRQRIRRDRERGQK